MNDDDRVLAVYEATDAELRAHYGDQEPLHLGTAVRWSMGGPDPLDGISVYFHPGGHWHYVGFGLSERAGKETNNPRVSGWGFELTFRLAAPAGIVTAELAPGWPIVLLNDFARYVFESRRPLAHGHFIERPGDPRGRYWGVVADPVLRPVETVNGVFAWLQVIDLDEVGFRRLQGDDYEAFLAEEAERRPLFVSTIKYGSSP